MASEPSLVPHDLRRESTDRRRIKTHKAKWVLGTRHGPGCGDELCTFSHHQGCSLKPRPEKFNNTRRKDHSYQMEKLSRLSHRGDKWDVLEEVEIATASEDDVSEKSAGDVDGITYSFDAPCGPQPGSHILSVALNRAVATFEGKQTDKLIKEEYEVVKSEPDDAPGVAGTICEVSALDDLEDFELL